MRQIHQQSNLEQEIARVIQNATDAKLEAIVFEPKPQISEEEELKQQQQQQQQDMDTSHNDEIEQKEQNDENIDAQRHDAPEQQNPEKKHLMNKLIHIGRDILIPVGVFSIASYLTFLFSESNWWKYNSSSCIQEKNVD